MSDSLAGAADAAGMTINPPMYLTRTLRQLVITLGILLAILAPRVASAQPLHGAVVDQTGLPLPGVRIDLERDGQVVQSVTTQGDGTFELTGAREADLVVATLDGFETTRAAIGRISPMVMPIAHATEVTQVTASALVSSGAAMERLGSTMTAQLAQRLPTSRPRILQSLPLLPGVIRGQDGQLRIGGTRPHESSLWIDGFDVTDPVTRTTTIDLPNEAVKGMAVLRDPISVTFSGVLGSLASIETTPGGDTFRAGIQGFIPRPRLTNYGLGRIEGFFPRAYAGGRVGRAHYFTSTELNFERVPVPGVTSRSGRPDIGASGVTTFVRLDFDISASQRLSFDGLFAPARTSFSGLSPLRGPEASPNVRTRDIVAGLVDRIVAGPLDLVTVRIGTVAHGTALGSNGSGDALLHPSGWTQNWFATADHWGTQRAVSVTWDHAGLQAHGSHTISTVGNVRHRAMDATIAERPIRVLDDEDRLVRLVEFGSGVRFRAADTFGGIGVRDLWDVNLRLQVDVGIRVDRGAETVASPRIGMRFALDDRGSTTLKASVGRFVGIAPLGAFGFGHFPQSRDSTFDRFTGAIERTVVFQPILTTIALPRADGVALDIEHRLTSHLEVEAGVRARHGSKLPTVIVAPNGGPLLLSSHGESQYRELQISVRQTWRADTQAFVSYVWSSSTGEINDFGSLYASLTTPFLQPGGKVVIPGDVPHRLRGWATFGLPHSVVVSPSVEWRTGFPYSVLTLDRFYAALPNNARFPNYAAADLTVFKTFSIYHRSMDLGLQFFNLGGHFNPRDVIAVQGSSKSGRYTNSFGTTLGGYMQVRW